MAHWFLLVLLIAHCAYSVFYLFAHKQSPNLFLIVIFCCLPIPALGGFIGIYLDMKGTGMLVNPSYVLLVPPMLYLYSRSLKDGYQWKWIYLVHFLPFLITNLLYIFVLPAPPMPGQRPEQHSILWIAMFPKIFGSITIGSYIAYSLLTYRFVREVKKDSEAFFSSNTAFMALNWIWKIILLYAILHLLEPLIMNLFGHNVIHYYRPAIKLIFGYSLSIYAFKQPLLQLKEQISLLKEANQNSTPIPPDNSIFLKKKPSLIEVSPRLVSSDNATSGIRGEMNPALQEAYIETIEKLMNEEKMFLDLELRLSDLAKKANIPLHMLSQLINDHYQDNFFNFVNSYRIRYAESIVKNKDYAHLTMSAIGLEAGFNSKSTFNTLFKKKYGMTPSAYKKKYQA